MSAELSDLQTVRFLCKASGYQFGQGREESGGFTVSWLGVQQAGNQLAKAQMYDSSTFDDVTDDSTSEQVNLHPHSAVMHSACVGNISSEGCRGTHS